MLGWASVVAAVAVVVTVALTQNAVWSAATLLVLLMFSSYALRSLSPRVASLALIGAITVYITGAGYITIGRIGWFVLALVVGFGWLAFWETLILPDNPLRSLNLSVHAFSRRAADTVSGAVDVLNTARDSTPSDAPVRHCIGTSSGRRCRGAIETQFPGAVVRGFSQNDVDQVRVALHSAQKGLEELADQAEVPDWMRSLPDQIAWSIGNTVHAVAAALRDDVDEESRDAVARKARILRGHIHGALTQAMKTGTTPFPPETLLAGLTLLRDAVEYAEAAARGDAAPVTGFGPTDESPSFTRGNDNTSLQLADSLWRVEDLAARLTELAQVFGEHSGLRAPTYRLPEKLKRCRSRHMKTARRQVRPPAHQASARLIHEPA